MELGTLYSKNDYYDIYKSDGKAVNVYRKPEYKEKCLYQALTHARVETTLLNYSSLKMATLHEVCVIDGKWCNIMDWIDGKTIEQLIAEDPERTEEYLDKLVEVQCEIHDQYMPLLSKLKDKMSRQIKSLKLDEIVKYELLTRLDSMPKHIKLCHNSFEPKNVIINDDGVYVINWGHARQGNASADVAKTYLLLKLHHEELADPYLERYCKVSGTSKKYVQAWLPIVAAAQLEKNIEEEHDFLMRWIDVFDYQ